MVKITSDKSVSDGGHVPRHLAIIMDGNGRWAKKRGLPRLFGHRQGAKAVTRTVEAAASLGVSVLTLFAFSSENWKRPQDEVAGLMDLFAKVLVSERERLHRNGIRVRFAGDLSRFSDALRLAVADIESLTRENTRMLLQIAVNYGGRWDIVQAAKSLAKSAASGEISPDDITEDLIRSRLAVTDDVDLLIRTGGEMRISNFLLYQCAYSEFYMTEVLWPDFGEAQLRDAFGSFSRRERRFGMTSEQVSDDALK